MKQQLDLEVIPAGYDDHTTMDVTTTRRNVEEEEPSDENDDTNDNNNKIDQPQSTTTATTTTRTTSLWMTRAAKRMARWPKTYFWVSLLLAILVSVLGMIYGDFSINTESIGWPSRGTLISNRHTQVFIVRSNNWELSSSGYTGSDETFQQLTTTVEQGWEGNGGWYRRRERQRRLAQEHHDDDRHRLFLPAIGSDAARDNRVPPSSSLADAFNKFSKTHIRRQELLDRQLDETTFVNIDPKNNTPIEVATEVPTTTTITDATVHSMPVNTIVPSNSNDDIDNNDNDNTDSLTKLINNCNLEEVYRDYSFFTSRKLWPTCKLKSDSSSTTRKSMLDPPAIQELCEAEATTQQVLQDNYHCRYTCNNGDCLPPFSLGFYVRLTVPGGLDMDCSTLATQWGHSHQAEEEVRLKECVAHLRTLAGQKVGEFDDLGPCPIFFSPSFVDEDFDRTGRSQHTSIMFASDSLSEYQYEMLDIFGGRNGDDDYDHIECAYDTQYGQFSNYYAEDVIYQQAQLAFGSMVVTCLALVVHTRSLFLSLVGILEIALAFPLAYTIYRFVFGLTFFPYLNLIGLFVLFALGADHVFVMVDKWKNFRIQYPKATTEDIAGFALPSAARAMALTTITTAAAFFGSVLCPVMPVRLFALFSGLLIVIDYILDVLIMFPCLCIYDGFRFQRNYFVHFGGATTTNISDEEVEKAKEPEGLELSLEASAMESKGDGKAAVKVQNADTDVGFVGTATVETSANGDGQVTNEDLETEPISVQEGQPSKDTLALALESHNLIRRVLSGYYSLLYTWRWVVVLLSMTALAVCLYFALQLEAPDASTDIQMFVESVEFEKNRMWRTELLLYDLLRASGSLYNAYVIWGVEAADTGDHNDPASFSELVLDETFDPSSTESQIYMRDFCTRYFEQDFATPVRDNYECPINRFDNWLETESQWRPEEQDPAYSLCANATGIPVPESVFHECISGWAQSMYVESVLSWNGTVRIMYFPYKSRVRFDSPNDVIKKEWNTIEDWMQEERDKAPPHVASFYFSNMDYWWWDTTQQVYGTARSSGAIAIAVSAVVILISSKSLAMTAISAVSVFYILASVTAMMFAAGWTLGFLESVCFTIVIGLSSDYVVHLSHAYTSLSGSVDRKTRSKFALLHLGPSILAAGITTLAGAVCLLFSIYNFFRLFATVMWFTIVQALVGSFVVFLSMTSSFGPSNPRVWADLLLSKCSKLGRRR